MSAPTTDWRDLLPSELKKLRKEAVAAGYVSPYPEPGKAPAIDVETDRCPACGKTPYVSLQGHVWCPYERCPQFGEPIEKEQS